MSYTYLASPYSHSDPQVREWRFGVVTRVAGALMATGEAVFCPITHSHTIDQACGLPSTHDFWMEMDIPILRHAARVKVLMLPGWENSKGIAQEVETAVANLIPVEYIKP